jgi:uncharacterized membrane protein
MIVTILASVFLVMLVAVIFYGYGFIMKSAKARDEENTERCTICRTAYDKGQLVERHVGDSRLFYFCKKCIGQLFDDSTRL